jgi:hypothetical protein
MDIARIDKATGVVVNIEVADQEWLDTHADDPNFAFEPYTPEQPAVIGLTHDPVTGFEQRKPDVETFELTADELTSLGVKAAAITTLRNDAKAQVES